MRLMFRLRNLIFLIAGTLLCLSTSAQTPAASNSPSITPSKATHYVAGKIDLMEGDAKIFDTQNVRRTVKLGDPVYEGDTVTTGANGEVHMTMDDEGFIAVRPNTTMRITQYRAEGDEQDTGVISLLVGSLRSVTGWIGKYHAKSYSIRTPTATIGIRGTDHEPMVIPEGSSEGEAGTYDKVNAGGSFINTAQGKVDVDPNHAAFAPHSGRAPRVLASVPRFFRPTRNEHLIAGKHEQIQRVVAQRRDERRQQIRSGLRPARPAIGAPGRQTMRERLENRVQGNQNRMQKHGPLGNAQRAETRQAQRKDNRKDGEREDSRKRLHRD